MQCFTAYPTCQPAAEFISELSGQLAASLLGDAGSQCEHHLQNPHQIGPFVLKRQQIFQQTQEQVSRLDEFCLVLRMYSLYSLHKGLEIFQFQYQNRIPRFSQKKEYSHLFFLQVIVIRKRKIKHWVLTTSSKTLGKKTQVEFLIFSLRKN